MFYQREIKTSPGGATSGRPYKSKDQAGMGTKGELQYAEKMTKVLPLLAETKFVQKKSQHIRSNDARPDGLNKFSGFTVAFYSGGLQGPCERHDGL